MTVGVMDSGIGGITTLTALMERCGGSYVYVCDKSSYGDKDDAFVLDRTMAACEKLKGLGAKIIVIACNTATNAAIATLRRLDGSVRYIGVEPAVKPALRECERVNVALTPTAARQSKFDGLIRAERDRINVIALPELAPQIEGAYMDKTALCKLAHSLLERVDGDGLVLGCTHYVFLKPYIREIMPGLKVYDGNAGVARRLYSYTGYMGSPSVKFVRLR